MAGMENWFCVILAKFLYLFRFELPHSAIVYLACEYD